MLAVPRTVAKELQAKLGSVPNEIIDSLDAGANELGKSIKSQFEDFLQELVSKQVIRTLAVRSFLESSLHSS
jgi:hypothetical protein